MIELYQAEETFSAYQLTQSVMGHRRPCQMNVGDISAQAKTTASFGSCQLCSFVFPPNKSLTQMSGT